MHGEKNGSKGKQDPAEKVENQDNKQSEKREKGMIAWFVNNRVTSNLIMWALLLGGLFMMTQIKQEVFPEFELDGVTVVVAYPGSSPEEVEQGIITAIESAVMGIEGVKEIRSNASEGRGWVIIWFYSDADRQKVHQDVKQAVDRITTFPQGAERPEVMLMGRQRPVLDIQLYGDVSELVLREMAERARDRLLQEPDISQVELRGARQQRILVEISQEALRRYGLTLQTVAARLGAASIEVPGGKLETPAGQVLLRVTDRRDWARQYAEIPIITTPEGTVILTKDIATVEEGFEDSNNLATFNGKRSIGLTVYRVGEQTPLDVSRSTRKAMAELERDLPPGIDWNISRDRSRIYEQRLNLLLKNAFYGLILVLIFLGLFLEIRLAFWVTMGIPISFLGAFLFLPSMGVSINMVSMFAFIVALGIVVDDAIVAGENIYEYRMRGMCFTQAAIQGTRDVAIPITFAIITNVVAFLPLAFIEGTMGKIYKAIPFVVVTVFLVSWVEAVLILPSHLAHARNNKNQKSLFRRFQLRIACGLEWFINSIYKRFLKLILRYRLLTIACGATVLIITLAYVRSGRIGMILMPRIEADVAVATAVLPYGSPMSEVEAVRDRLEAAMEEIKAEHGGEKLVEGVFSVIEENQVEVFAFLQDPDVRPLPTHEVTELWREKTGRIPGLQFMRFESDRGGPGAGAALTVELSHRHIDTLNRASEALAEKLEDFAQVTDIDSGYTPGKRQLNFKLTPEGQSLGLSSREIGRQVRDAFYGAEAKRQQRLRSEVRVLVRLPEEQRTNEFFVENLLVTTPDGRFVPLRQVALLERGRSYTSIDRRDGRRIIRVTANVTPLGMTSRVISDLNSETLPVLARDYPGLAYEFRGRRQHMAESLSSLWSGFGIAMIVIFFLLAIPFRSYVQPIIVMIAIPFGLVGAVFGHVLMGYDLSLMSMMGIVALAGVVVNDSLVFIDYANKRVAEGKSSRAAVILAGTRRFRPILLTTLTTFGGLTPMMLETSRQARFMIPMAISLGFGILFATIITLVLVPCLFLFIQDVRNLLTKYGGRLMGTRPETMQQNEPAGQQAGTETEASKS